MLGRVHAVLDAVAQALHDGEVDFLFADEVLDAVVDTRVVVHLDNDRVAVDFLEVHAVEPVTDEACHAERRLHDAVGYALDGQAVPLAAGSLFVLAIPVINLPVVLGHVVLAGVKRLAVEDADSPVEVGGREFLRDEQVAVLEHRVENFFELFLVVRLLDAETETRIGRLDDHGEAEFFSERVAVLAVHDNRLGGGNLAYGHEFLQVDLVGTTQDAVGVVDDGDAFALGAARERVGVVVHVRRLADENGVEFAYAVVVLLGDELHAESRILRSLDEVVDGLLVARRFHFVGVHEDAEVVHVVFALGGGVARLLEVLDGELVHHLLVCFGDFVDADGADALDEPFLLEHELGAEQRGLEYAVEFLRELQVLGAHVLAEVDGEHEFGAGQLVQALLDELVDIVADDFYDGRGLEIADVLDVRDDLVAASLSKQAYIVAFALVAVVAAQVEYAHALLGGKVGIGQVIFC